MDEILYLAGLFDGEGSFSIQAQFRNSTRIGGQNSRTMRFNPRMTMSLKAGYGDTESVMEMLVRNLGGAVYHDNIGLHKWSVGKVEHLKEICDFFVPLLVVKKDIGNRFRIALDNFPSRTGVAQGLGGRSWDNERCKLVTKMAYELNPGNRFARSIEEIYREIDLYYV